MQFWHFISKDPHLGPVMPGQYTSTLVVLSACAAILAAYSALAVVDRIVAAPRTMVRKTWLAVGATAMGVGIWAMHFIAMLAFSLPVPVDYDSLITIASVVPAIVGSGVALHIMSRSTVEHWRLQVGGLSLAVGIGAMHYTGMEAMRFHALMGYDIGLFALSIVVAYVLATAALYLRFALRSWLPRTAGTQWLGAVVLGMAVTAMHYTAMAAAQFYLKAEVSASHHVTTPYMLAFLIAGSVTFLLSVTLIGTLVDRRLATAAQSLHESGLRHSAVLDALADGVVTFDSDGQIESVNPAAERILGGGTQPLVGQPVERFLNNLRRSLVSSPPGGAESGPLWTSPRSMEAVRADYKTVPVEVVVSQLRIGDRQAFSAVVRDITERREAERAQAQYVLEMQKAQAKLQLQARELAVARDRAEAAAVTKSEFLAAMSHEIRTPMNGVLGMAQLLLDSQLTEEQADQIRILHSSGLALLTIINDILDFSKIEAGKLQIEPIPFDLETAAAEVSDIVAAAAAQKKIELVLRFSADSPRYVVGDPGRIRQVLLNLLSNAIKFTEQGHVLIEVDGRQDGDHAVFDIAVEDTGIGMSNDVVAKLFQSFTQADHSTTRKYGGTGLGLAISKRLVELMGGTIGVSSSLGAGSRFWFKLRLPNAPVPPSIPMPSLDLTGQRVLVVDDTEVNRRVLSEQLRRWGLVVDVASGPKAALLGLLDAANTGTRYAIAVLDYCMPEMDGLDLGRVIVGDPRFSPLALVLLTSAARQGDASRARDIGFGAYLTKPASPDNLRRAIEAAYLTANPDRAAAEEPTHSAPSCAPQPVSPSSATRLHRILLAEDNVVNQKVAVRMLERLGCRVDVASNGYEALSMWQQFPYEIVFLDCQMPELDGYGAARAIRAAEGPDRRTPLVAITANAMEGARDRCLDAGMDDYTSKPVQVDALRAILERYLGRAGSALPQLAQSDGGTRDREHNPFVEARLLSVTDRAETLPPPADRADLGR